MQLDEMDDDPEVCAHQVLNDFFDGSKPSFPIDPFKIIRSFGAVYQVARFEDSEGFYLPALDRDDIDLIAIKYDSRITRQRFTAGHELWHFLKDNPKAKENKRDKRQNEKAANRFAAELLAPSSEVALIAKSYLDKDGYVSFDSALEIAEHFGISFQACAFSLLDLGLIGEGPDIREAIGLYDADKRREALGKPIDDCLLICQMVDS